MNCLLWTLSIRVSSFHGSIQAIRVLMRQKICSSNNVMSLTTFQNNYGTNAGMHLTICLNSWLCWTAAVFLSKVRCKTTQNFLNLGDFLYYFHNCVKSTNMMFLVFFTLLSVVSKYLFIFTNYSNEPWSITHFQF